VAKKKDYRLKVLFEIREKEKEKAEDIYAQKQKQVAIEKKKLDEMNEHLKGMVAHREERKEQYNEAMRSGALTIDGIQSNDRHIERLKQEEAAYQIEITRQQENLRDAQELAEEAKEDMLKATQDFKALEKHREKWDKQVRKEMMLKEEEQAEDIAQAQYYKRLKERG
jgi:hypothetical protein